MSESQAKADLTIAIPTFNNVQQLVDTLGSLIFNVEHPFKIVVINNGDEADRDGNSFEESVRKRVQHPLLEIHQMEENAGWQGGINTAFEKYCDTPFFCMMNDDLCFPAGNKAFFRRMIQYFLYAEVGAVGPCSNFVMGSQNLWLYGNPLVLETTLLVGFLMVVRSKAFSELGGLDSGLIGGDDLDLSILLRKHGYKLLVDRQCYVHHIGCQTGYRVGAKGLDWNSWDHQDMSNNSLIRKHGVRWWFECLQARTQAFQPVTAKGDEEGDVIRGWIEVPEVGLGVGRGHNKTSEGPGGVGLAGGRKTMPAVNAIVSDACTIPREDGS